MNRKEYKSRIIPVAEYITVLDFEIGRIFQYKIGVNDVEGEYHSNKWYPDGESCEEFLAQQGHNLTNCEWMVHDIKEFVDTTIRSVITN